MKLLIYDFNLPYLIKNLEYPIGGASIETLALIKGFLFNGCKVGVITWKGAKDFIGEDTEVDVVEAFDEKIGIRKIRWIYYRYPALFKAIKYYSPDYLWQEAAGIATGILAHIAKNLNIPFIYRVSSDIDVDKRIKQHLSFNEWLIYKYGLKNSKYIITQNDYQYNMLEAQYPNKKIYIIYNAFYPFREFEELKERKYIAWLGVFSKAKNLPALLHIVNQLPNIQFKIAGMEPTSGMDKNTKKALIALSKCKNVQFVGYLNRLMIMNFIANAYALISTSHYEGFSNTFLEAFSAGTPVISLNSDPNKILKKHELGFVVNLQNVAHTIKELVSNYDYEACKVRMREYLDSFHNYKTVSKKLIDILKSY